MKLKVQSEMSGLHAETCILSHLIERSSTSSLSSVRDLLSVACSLVLNGESHSQDEEKSLSSRTVFVGCGEIRYLRKFFGQDLDGVVSWNGGDEKRSGELARW